MIAPTGFLESDAGTWHAQISNLSVKRAAQLAVRTRHAPLYAHAFSFHLNFRFGGMKPIDLLDFASEQNLTGVKIHVEDGEHNSLQADRQTWGKFGERARSLGLDVHIETSVTTGEGLGDAIAIAKATGATSVRCYPRYEARVSEIITRTISDLKQLAEFDPEGALLFTLEQHEDLTSSELVHIIESVGNPNLSLLFDFGNMVNAYERPLEALAAQSAYITQVHIKDCWVRSDRGGWAQLGCKSGTGHLPFAELLLGLLLLGEDAPQVNAFALEEEADYFAPAMRFPTEEEDPLIKFRTSSLTPVAEAGLDERLQRERDEALMQVVYVRGLLEKFENAANRTVAKANS